MHTPARARFGYPPGRFGYPPGDMAKGVAFGVRSGGRPELQAAKNPFLTKLLLPRLIWMAHERRRDLARFDGSRFSASMMFQSCFLAVETNERMSAKSMAPSNDRKPPEIF